jgi:hypothetical protein
MKENNMHILKSVKDFFVMLMDSLHEAKEMQRKSRRIP